MRRRGIGRRGRPGLAGTMARTAVVAGTATAVAGNVSRRQQQRAGADQAAADQAAAEQAAAQQAAAPPPPPPAPPADMVTQLTELASLLDAGILTEDEFAAQKARILAQ